jgi:hypothetical protein
MGFFSDASRQGLIWWAAAMVEGMVVAVPTGVKAEAAADASAPKADSPKSVLEDEVIFGSEAVQHF